MRLQLGGEDSRTKKISSWLVELYGSPDDGGMIRVWKKADRKDAEIERQLPYDVVITRDEQYVLFEEIYCVDFFDARNKYRGLRTVGELMLFLWKER